jgi:hypothetical protein
MFHTTLKSHAAGALSGPEREARATGDGCFHRNASASIVELDTTALDEPRSSRLGALRRSLRPEEAGVSARTSDARARRPGRSRRTRAPTRLLAFERGSDGVCVGRPLAGHFIGRLFRDASHSAASGSGHAPGSTSARGSGCDARQSVRQVVGPEDRGLRGDEAGRGIVEDVALEATPVALVGSEVAASPAAGSVGLEGMQLRPSTRGDLEHLAAIEVAGVDDEGDAWVALEQLSEPLTIPRSATRKLALPTGTRAVARSARFVRPSLRAPRGLAEEPVEVNAIVDGPRGASTALGHEAMLPGAIRRWPGGRICATREEIRLSPTARICDVRREGIVAPPGARGGRTGARRRGGSARR